MTSDCVFCKIVKRELPAAVVSESPEWLSFNDTKPQAPVHVVLIPKKHAANLSEFSKSDGGLVSSLIFEAERIAREKKLDKPGYRLVLNCNTDGGQTVSHLHFHILGGRRMAWPPG